MGNKSIIKVLLVDGENLSRAATKAAFKIQNFRIVAVGDDCGAMNEGKNDTIDIVVLDARMPGLDENAALRKIRALEPELPVVIITGYGFRYVSTKPIGSALPSEQALQCEYSRYDDRISSCQEKRTNLQSQNVS